MTGQTILRASGTYKELDDYLNGNGIRSFLLVCGGSIRDLKINACFKQLKERTGIRFATFSHFQPNPLYESVQEGIRVFRESGCRHIIAVGGGSAIDVAKCIKLYSSMQGDGRNGSFLHQKIVPNDVKLIAVPTTAGSGSEATRYAVIYYGGEKQTVMHDSILPDMVLLDSSTLNTLPLYHKKSAMLDALCHSIESYWSANSTVQSRKYSAEAVRLILAHMDGCLANREAANGYMLEAAHIAGKAINIAQTAAGHAMSYKLTGLYGIAHGHAAALCVRALWPWMLKNKDRCTDPRGAGYLDGMFLELAECFGSTQVAGGAEKFGHILDNLELPEPEAEREDYKILSRSVNQTRLKNSPVKMREEDLAYVYRKILNL